MAGDSETAASNNQNRRVKVYVLGGDGQWEDRGTGYVNCELIAEHDALGLRVVSEQEASKDLLVTKIFEEEVFQRQGDTIVTWTNPDTREDVALSFQEAPGAQEVWEIICQVQGRSPDDGGEDAGASGEGHGSDCVGADFKLPAPEMDNLLQLQEIVSNATAATRDRIVDSVMADGYLTKLLSIFRDCEDLEMTNSLHSLFRIFKGLIMLNEPQLIEACLSDAFFMDTMGILEYDPDYPKHEMKHREYLESPGLFKQAVPISHQATLAKIHLNFRLTYLKDVVMARYIDDISFGTIRELIMLNNIEIIGHIQSDTPFLQKLFQVCSKDGSSKTGATCNGVHTDSQSLATDGDTEAKAKIAGSAKSPADTVDDRDVGTRECGKTGQSCGEDQQRINGFLFLRELFDIVKPLQMMHQMSFFRALTTVGIFPILEGAIKSQDPIIVGASTEMLLSTLNHDASMLRSYIINESSQPTGLLSSLIHGLLHYQDVGLKAQMADIVRFLLDSTAIEVSPERDSFLNIFYDEQMDTLLSPFLQPDMWTEDGLLVHEADKDEAEEDAAKQALAEAKAKNREGAGLEAHRDALHGLAAVAAKRRERKACWDCARKHVVELLSFSVEHHGHRIKYYMLRNNVMLAVTQLLQQADKHLVLTALKFLRQCVGVQEVFYNRYIVKKDLFKGVMDLLQRHLHRNNLINSAIIELVDHIRVKNVKELIKYMVDRYRSVYEKLEYVDTYKMLIVKYDQNEQYEMDAASGSTSAAGGSGEVQEDDDEDYFNQEDDEEDEHGPPRPSGLINDPGRNTDTLQENKEPEAPTGLAALGAYDDEEEVSEGEVQESAKSRAGGADDDGEANRGGGMDKSGDGERREAKRARLD